MKNKNLILSRSFLLAFSFVGLVWAYVNLVLLHDTTIKFSLKIVKMNSVQFFSYFTIWSNIFCFVWSSLAIISIIQENPKLEKLVNHWAVKSTPVVWIGITFLVLNFDLFPGVIIKYGISDALKFWLGISIFQHVLVPIFMVNDFRLTKGFSKETKYSKKEITINSLIAIIPGLIWIMMSILLLWKGVIKPQYPFMKFFNVSSSEVIKNSCIVVAVAFLFVFFNVLLFYYHNKKFKKKTIQKVGKTSVKN